MSPTLATMEFAQEVQQIISGTLNAYRFNPEYEVQRGITRLRLMKTALWYIRGHATYVLTGNAVHVNLGRVNTTCTRLAALLEPNDEDEAEMRRLLFQCADSAKIMMACMNQIDELGDEHGFISSE